MQKPVLFFAPPRGIARFPLAIWLETFWSVARPCAHTLKRENTRTQNRRKSQVPWTLCCRSQFSVKPTETHLLEQLRGNGLPRLILKALGFRVSGIGDGKNSTVHGVHQHPLKMDWIKLSRLCYKWKLWCLCVQSLRNSTCLQCQLPSYKDIFTVLPPKDRRKKCRVRRKKAESHNSNMDTVKIQLKCAEIEKYIYIYKERRMSQYTVINKNMYEIPQESW